METEIIWRDCTEFPAYEISSYGHFRNKRLGRVLEFDPDSSGYNAVNLFINGKKLHKRTARLVAETWIGPRPTGCQVNHIDGNKRNDSIENMEYVSPSENIKHAYRLGLLSRKGEKNSCAKLTQIKADEIRRRCASGESQKNLATEFGVDASNISTIVAGRSW